MIQLLTLLLGASLYTMPADEQNDCDNRRMRGTSTSIHSDSDDNHGILSFVHTTDDRCESATIIGRLTFTPDEDDVLSMPFGGSATFRERTSGTDRALSLMPGSGGQIIRSYQVNGRSAEYDADARRWLAGFLPRVLMLSGTNVEPRIARWRAKGGVDNVLRNIESIESSGAMRAHYIALLDGSRLSDDEIDHTIRSVSENMRTSSGDLRSVLSRLAPAERLSKRGLVSLEHALTGMPSSGDRSSVLQLFGQTGNRDMLLVVMRAAETIPSSGDKSRVLQNLAARYLNGDTELRRSWFTVAETIPSSGDLRSVLMMAVPYSSSSDEVARAIITTSQAIASSGDRSSVLLALARSGALREKSTRDAFVNAVGQIPSDGDKARVLQALVNGRD